MEGNKLLNKRKQKENKRVNVRGRGKRERDRGETWVVLEKESGTVAQRF